MTSSDTPFRARFEQALREFADAVRDDTRASDNAYGAEIEAGHAECVGAKARALMEMVEEMEKQNARLNLLLARYGEHDRECFVKPAQPETCTCGFTALLVEIANLPDPPAPYESPSASLGEVQHGGQ